MTTDLAKNAASGALNQAITEKMSGELNKLQDRLGDKLGRQLPNLGRLANPNSGNSNTDSTQPLGGLGNSLEEGLQKGLGDLFK